MKKIEDPYNLKLLGVQKWNESVKDTLLFKITFFILSVIFFWNSSALHTGELY